MIPEFLIARFGPALAKLIFWLVVALLVVALLGVAKCTYDQGAKTRVKVAEGQAGAAVQSGQDAANTVGNRMEADAATDQLTRNNADEIRKADGASAPVAPGVRDAGLASLCRRPAYRGNPKCVQQPNPR